MLTQQEMLAAAVETIREAFVGVFTTVDLNGVPHSRCMGAAAEEHGLHELFTLTGKHTQKLENLRRNPAVSWVFSTGDYERVVTLKGEAEILESPVIAQKAWDRLAEAARAYSMNALSDEANLSFVVIKTRIHYADLLYPKQEIVRPEPIEIAHAEA